MKEFLLDYTENYEVVMNKYENREILLVNAEKAAQMCGFSRSQWWKLSSTGKIPLPIKIGRKTLLKVDELIKWIDSGCPSRDIWEERK